MPCFVIVDAGRACLCEPGPLGHPDRGTDVPVKIQALTDRSVSIEGEPRPRAIVSALGCNGSTTLLVSGSIRDGSHRAAVAKAGELLKQLCAALVPLAEDQDDRETVTEAVGLLFNLIGSKQDRGIHHGT